MEHQLHWSILREYDIRGEIDDTLQAADAYAIGRAFATRIIRNGGKVVCVGYDGRLSSPDMEESLNRGLVDSGAAVIRIGLGPTPMVYFASKTLNTDGGIMITGSHNPANYNGFKMVMDNKPFYGEDIQSLDRIAAIGDYESGDGFVTQTSIFADYVNRIRNGYDGERELKVAWDAGNGVTGPAIEALTRDLPGEHILLYTRVDGTFPNHHPDPTVPENLVQLIDTVKSEKCDLGIAFDGDGDRIGVVDSHGRIVWGDQLMSIFANDVLISKPGATVIADVKSSNHLFDNIRDLGGTPIMWRTGHSLIKKKIAETGAVLAGEMSGHIFFNDRYYGYDDALYAAVRLLGVLGRSKCSIAGMVDRMPATVTTPELRFQCDDSRKFGVVDEVKKRLVKEGAEMNVIDGVRVNAENGWWLLRASNTQDVLVARCEADNEDSLDLLKHAVVNQLQQSGIKAEIH